MTKRLKSNQDGHATKSKIFYYFFDHMSGKLLLHFQNGFDAIKLFQFQKQPFAVNNSEKHFMIISDFINQSLKGFQA